MKNLFLLIILITISINAQVGIGTTTPNNSAQLDVTATNKGVLIPRMTLAQKNAITSPATSLLIYQTNGSTGYYFYNGIGWTRLTTVEKIDDLLDGKSDNDGTNDGSSIFLGVNAGNNDDLSDNRNIAIGYNTLQNNVSATSNVAIGYGTAISTTGGQNVAIGSTSLVINTTGENNVSIGENSLHDNNGNNNTIIGKNAAIKLNAGDSNVMIGSFAGNRDINNSNDNVYIGNYSGAGNVNNGNPPFFEKSGNVFIGNESGRFSSESNRLYIENTSSTDPLIYGEFDNDLVRINGELQIGNPTGTGYKFPTIDGTVNQVLKTDANGQLSFVDASSVITEIGDISAVNAGDGLIGGGTSGDVTLNVVATNGLTATANDIKLGGNLTQFTSINLGNNGMSINLNGNGSFSVNNNAGTFSNGLRISSDGENYFDGITHWNTSNSGTKFADLTENTGSGILKIYNNGSIRHEINADGTTSFNLGNQDNDFKIGTISSQDTFYVDAGNERIGIGTDMPLNKMHIEGDLRVTNLATASNHRLVQSDTNGVLSKLPDGFSNYILKTDGAGNFSFVDPNSLITTDVEWIDDMNTPNTLSPRDGENTSLKIGGTTGSGQLIVQSNSFTPLSIESFATGTGDINNNVNTFLNNASTTGNKTNIYNLQFSDASGSQLAIKNEFFNNSPSKRTGIKNIFTGITDSSQIGFYNDFNVTKATASNGDIIGVKNTIQRITATHNGNQFGVDNDLSTKGTGDQCGISNLLETSSTGTQFGSQNILRGDGNGLKYGVYSKIEGVGSNTKYGIYADVIGATNAWAGLFLGKVSIGTTNLNTYTLPSNNGTNGQIMQLDNTGQLNFVDISSQAITTANNGLTLSSSNVKLGGTLIEDTNINYGNFDTRFNLNGTGDFIIQDAGTGVFSVLDNGETTIGRDTYWKDNNISGTLLAKLYDSNDDGVFDVYQGGAVKNRIHGNGDSFITGGNIGFGLTNPNYQVDIKENDNAKLRALNLIKTDNTASPSIGAYFEKNASGTGNSRVLYLLNKGTGTGKKYGIYNRLESNANGNHYAIRNVLKGNTSSNQTGVFNDLTNTGNGAQYGIYNGMRGSNASKTIGVWNEFITAVSNDTIVGVFNSFKEGTPGNNGHVGMQNRFSNNHNGNYYGTKTIFQNNATGTGNKYGNYTSISSSANGTHYGTYNSVSATKGWAGYFLGKNYISNRLSIGETNNANASLSIRKNSNNTDSHITLKETGLNDGARIRFENTSETTNHLIFYGRPDNTSSLSRFNFYFSNLNDNVLEIYGDRDVQIKGRLGINFTDPTYALQLPNNNTVSVGYARAKAWTTYSDTRIKKEQQKIIYGLSTVLKIKPKSYVQYNSEFVDNKLKLDDKSGTKDIGFIAQELYKIIPEVVEKPADENKNLWAVNYEKIVPVAIQAIKELNTKIENLKAENENLKAKLSKIDALEARLNELENKQNNSELVDLNSKN